MFPDRSKDLVRPLVHILKIQMGQASAPTGVKIESRFTIRGIGDIKKIGTTKKLAGFIGAHPGFNDSGKKIGHAHIGKAGN